MRKFAWMLCIGWLGISAATLSASNVLLDLKSGDLYNPLPNHETTAPRQVPTEDHQPPIDKPKGFDYSRQEIDYIGREPRREEYTRFDPDKYGPQIYTKTGEKRPKRIINIRTLPDGTFQRYNPETHKYEDVISPND